MTTLDAAWAKRWMCLARDAVQAERARLIELDREIGDGDHGENMDRGFHAVVDAIESASPTGVDEVLKLAAKSLMSTVGGAAGPLYGTAFLRAAKAAGNEVDAKAWVAMVTAALEGIQARGKATTGEKTMVDAWSAALDNAQQAVADGASLVDILAATAEGARRGEEATTPMRATKGRASYLGERSIGHVDPGAASTTLILAAAHAAVEGGACG